MASAAYTALVVRKTKLGETDIIVTLVAEDGSQRRAVAKGLRKPGSRFGGRLEPGSVVDLLVHEGRNLGVVTEARSVDQHAGLRADYGRSAAASVVCDVLDKLTLEGQTEPRLFALGVAALSTIEHAAPEAITPLVDAFLIKALAMHGSRPELGVCAACGIREAAAFSFASGGTLCAECAQSEPGAFPVSEATVEWLTALMSAKFAEVAELEMPAAAAVDCFALLRGFVGHHVHARLKALEMYEAG